MFIVHVYFLEFARRKKFGFFFQKEFFLLVIVQPFYLFYPEDFVERKNTNVSHSLAWSNQNALLCVSMVAAITKGSHFSFLIANKCMCVYFLCMPTVNHSPRYDVAILLSMANDDSYLFQWLFFFQICEIVICIMPTSNAMWSYDGNMKRTINTHLKWYQNDCVSVWSRFSLHRF